MNATALPYLPGRYPLTDVDLAAWTSAKNADGWVARMTGPCPRCGHGITQEVTGRSWHVEFR